jgi:hypothetical protein
MRIARTCQFRMALILMLMLGAGLAQAAGTERFLTLLPKDGEIEGWVRDGTPILCRDEESLSEHIDGAAPFYLERGAVAVLFQYYLREGRGGDLKIEMYQMKDDFCARRLFEEIQSGRPPSNDPGVKGLGEDRHLEQALREVWLLEFHGGPFFVRMEATGEGTEGRDAVLQFGSWVSDSVRGSEKAR